MSSQQRPSVLALAALLFCTAPHGTHGSGSASASSFESPFEEDSGMQRGRLNHDARPWRNSSSPGNASAAASLEWSPASGASSALCAYQVTEGGIGGPLCFRHMLLGYKCHIGECRSAVSSGSLVANILVNGSVLLQWGRGGKFTAVQGSPGRTADPGTNSSREEKANSVFSGRRHRRGGYELSCWWNGSYTQFECAGVRLGSGCKDFLLSELHENIPYRICLRPADQRAADRKDCVEFTLPPSGMQDIVIAMTTVGGAICVMLVIICLLVAYITENIMSPATQHTYSYRTRSRR